MRKRIIFILLTLLMLGTIGFLYIHKILIPLKLKSFLKEKSKEYITTELNIEDISYSMLKGFVFHNVELLDENRMALIQIDEVSLKAMLIPLLKNKNLVIPAIKISNPYINLQVDENNMWNILNTLKPKDIKDKKTAEYSVLIKNIDIEHGSLDFKDNRNNVPFETQLNNLKLKLQVGLNQKITFRSSANTLRQQSLLSGEGEYDFKKRLLSTRLSLNNINLKTFAEKYLTYEKLTIYEGLLSSKNINVSYKNNTWTAKGELNLLESDMLINQKRRFLSNAYLNDIDVTFTGGVLSGNTNFSALKAEILPLENVHIQSDIDADIKQFTLSKEELKSTGVVSMNNTVLTIDDDKQFKSNIRWSNVSYSKIENTRTIKGSAEFTSSDFRIPGTFAYKGDILAKDILLVYDENQTNIESVYQLIHPSLEVNNMGFRADTISIAKSKTTYEKGRTTFNGNLDTKDFHIKLANNQTFTGSPKVDLLLNFDNDKNVPFSYNASAELTGGSLENIPFIETAENIQGNIKLTEDNFETKTPLTFESFDTSITLNGQTKGLTKDAFLDVRVSTESISFNHLKSLTPWLFEKINGQLTGTTSVDLKYKGEINSPRKADITCKAALNNVSYSNEKLKDPIQNVSGILDYEKFKLQWSNLKGQYKNKTYTAEGTLEDFLSPDISTTLVTDNVNIDAKFQFEKDLINIKSFKGQFYHSSFDGKGALLPGMILQTDGLLTLNMDDLKHFISVDARDKLENLDLKGVLKTSLSFKGTKNDWKNWELSLNSTSNRIWFKTLPFDNLNLQYTQQNKRVRQLTLNSLLYGGQFQLEGSADLSKTPLYSLFKINLQNLDLAVLREERKINQENMSGLLNLSSNLDMNLFDINSLNGTGALSIENGYIWQHKVLAGLAKNLLIPEFQRTVFTDASGNFTVSNRKVFTRNLSLNSKTIDLIVRGSVDFDKNLLLNIYPKFSEIALIQSDSLKKGPTSLLTQSVEVNITGTLNKPQYKVNSSAMKVLKDTTGIITEGIGSILGDIF